MESIIYNQKGKEAGKITLSDAVFNLPFNSDLVHQVQTGMLANARTKVAHVKDRGQVSGSGKKPWRQKGTGRARHGSIRSPLWSGGGVTHGPTAEKDYSKKINKKMSKKAFYTALSQKLRDGEIMFLDNVSLKDAKTKEAAGVLSAIAKVEGFEKLATKKNNKAIFVLPKKDDEIKRSFRNLSGSEVYEARNLNLLDILNYKYLVLVNAEEGVKVWK